VYGQSPAVGRPLSSLDWPAPRVVVSSFAVLHRPPLISPSAPPLSLSNPHSPSRRSLSVSRAPSPDGRRTTAVARAGPSLPAVLDECGPGAAFPVSVPPGARHGGRRRGRVQARRPPAPRARASPTRRLRYSRPARTPARVAPGEGSLSPLLLLSFTRRHLLGSIRGLHDRIQGLHGRIRSFPLRIWPGGVLSHPAALRPLNLPSVAVCRPLPSSFSPRVRAGMETLRLLAHGDLCNIAR